MEKSISEALKNSRKIVIKIGSNTLAKSDGTQNIEFMENFARQCKKLIDMGKQIVLVSSGAQVSGVSTLKEWARKKDVHFRQALCAIGQVELMSQWRKAFASQNIHIGQLLFTKDDLQNVFDKEHIGRVWTISSNDEKNVATVKEGFLWK